MEYDVCTPLLQEKYEYDPGATKDPTIKHLIVCSVGGRITSIFFVGDLKIIAKDYDVVNAGKKFFVLDPK